MQNGANTAKIAVKTDGWVTCPYCRRNKRLLRINQDTEARNLQVYCRDCKHELILNIAKGQRVELRSQ